MLQLLTQQTLAVIGTIFANILAIVFIAAACAKLRRVQEFSQVLDQLGLRFFRLVAAYVISMLELMVGLMFALRWELTTAVTVAAGLLLIFYVTGIYVLLKRKSVSCSCFGSGGALLGVSTIVRSSALGVLVFVVAISGDAILNGVQIFQAWVVALCVVLLYSCSSRLIPMLSLHRA